MCVKAFILFFLSQNLPWIILTLRHRFGIDRALCQDVGLIGLSLTDGWRLHSWGMSDFKFISQNV